MDEADDSAGRWTGRTGARDPRLLAWECLSWDVTCRTEEADGVVGFGMAQELRCWHRQEHSSQPTPRLTRARRCNGHCRVGITSGQANAGHAADPTGWPRRLPPRLIATASRSRACRKPPPIARHELDRRRSRIPTGQQQRRSRASWLSTEKVAGAWSRKLAIP